MRLSRLAAGLIATAFVCAPARAAAPARPRGLILISIDTLRADHLGAYGASPAASPAFDAFAAQGILFENAYSAATWTVPSHATILTGLYPSSHGAGGFPEENSARGFSPDAATLAELLRARGFRTAAFHFGPTLDARWGFDRGFDVYETGHLRDVSTAGARDERSLLEEWQSTSTTVRATLEETTFGRAADWLARQDGRAPYFLFVHTFAVHRYGRIALDADGGSSCPPRFDFALNLKNVTSADDPRCPLARRRYASAVRCVDGEFGRLMAGLDAAGARDAVVIVVSDHGEALCEARERAGLIGHGYAPYEEQLRVPLAVRLPDGLFAGRRSSETASLVDVLPTALDALRLDPPPGTSGTKPAASRSAAPDLRGLGPLADGAGGRLRVHALRGRRRGALRFLVRHGRGPKPRGRSGSARAPRRPARAPAGS
ncbi:MAG: sulfatase [Elusimicrobiota bacterium]